MSAGPTDRNWESVLNGQNGASGGSKGWDSILSDKIAAATNVPSKGGPDPSKLQASVRILSEWRPGEEQTGATQRNGNYWFSDGSIAVSPDLAHEKGLDLHDKVGFMKNGQIVGTGYYDDHSFYTPNHPTSNTIEIWGHPAEGHYDDIVKISGDDRSPEAGTKEYHDQAIQALGAKPAAIKEGEGAAPNKPAAAKTETEETQATAPKPSEEEEPPPQKSKEEKPAPQPQQAQAQPQQPDAEQQAVQADQEENVGGPFTPSGGGLYTPQQVAIQESVVPKSKQQKSKSEDEEEEEDVSPIVKKYLYAWQRDPTANEVS